MISLAIEGGVAIATLCRPPVNAIRLTLHPRGLAPKIVDVPIVPRPAMPILRGDFITG